APSARSAPAGWNRAPSAAPRPWAGSNPILEPSASPRGGRMVSLLENTERDGTVADETGTVPAKDGKATDEGTQAESPFPEATKLVEDIQTLLGLEDAVRNDGGVDLHVEPQKVQEVAFRLRDELRINYLSSLAAVDWKDEGLEVVYHILELGTPRRIVMRARVPRDDA